MSNPFRTSELTDLGESDETLLQSLLTVDDSLRQSRKATGHEATVLTDRERFAFVSMRNQLLGCERAELTSAQRTWVQRVSTDVQRHEDDAALLELLLEQELREFEERMLSDMDDKLTGATSDRPRLTLTDRQREVVERVADRIGVRYESRRT